MIEIAGPQHIWARLFSDFHSFRVQLRFATSGTTRHHFPTKLGSLRSCVTIPTWPTQRGVDEAIFEASGDIVVFPPVPISASIQVAETTGTAEAG